MASTSNSIFTGSSAYSQDFQNLITRAVNIASLPITQLTSEKNTLAGQCTEMATLSGKFSNLQSTVTEISNALSNSCGVTSSAPTVVSASAGPGAVAGSYSILVSDPGAYSTMMTGTWNAAAGPAHTYQLWVGNIEYDITPADNSAASVATAINASRSGQVHATVVNVGSDAAPDYRLSLQSVSLTTDALDLRDAGSLAAVQHAGHAVQYEVGDSGVPVSSASRTLTIATGVTLNIQNSSATPVQINVTSSNSALAGALSDFAGAYNAAVTELGNQSGKSAGPLQGNSLVMQLSGVLSGIATFSGSGLNGLRDLGLDLGSDGKLTFDGSQLSTTVAANPGGVTAFLGSVSGSGFLARASSALTSVQDPVAGLLPTAQANLQNQITRLAGTIDTKQAQVDNLQTQLQKQMAAADAAIAAMEQQFSYLSNMFQAMQTAAQQYK